MKRKELEGVWGGQTKKLKTNQNFSCHYCQAVFYNQESLSNHLQISHKDKFNHKCSLCSFQTNNMIKYSQHCQEVHKCFVKDETSELLQCPPPPIYKINRAKAVLGKRARQRDNRGIFKRYVWNYKGGDDMHTTLNNMREKIKSSISKFIIEKNDVRSIKYHISVLTEFARLVDARTDEWTRVPVYFNGEMRTIYNIDEDFQETFDKSVGKIWESTDAFVRNGSGWVFQRIQRISLDCYRYQPFVGSSYIPTPSFIANKNFVNVTYYFQEAYDIRPPDISSINDCIFLQT